MPNISHTIVTLTLSIVLTLFAGCAASRHVQTNGAAAPTVQNPCHDKAANPCNKQADHWYSPSSRPTLLGDEPTVRRKTPKHRTRANAGDDDFDPWGTPRNDAPEASADSWW